MDQREFLNFQQNLRRTALGVRFGKELLSNPESLSPKTITDIFRAMGLPIPREIQLGADAAQAIVTGAAVVDKYRAGTSLTNYREIIKPSAASMGVLVRVANELGWTDDRTASQLRAALDVALIISSCGMNVQAWVSLAMSINSENLRAEMEASFEGQKRAIDQINGRMNKEKLLLLGNVERLQAGELGLFSFLAESVDSIPLLFENAIVKNPAFAPLVDKLPGLNFLPKGTWWVEGTGRAETWWGEGKRETVVLPVSVLEKFPGQNAFDYLIYNLIWPSATQYLRARENYLMQGRADIFKVAIFALFENRFILEKNSATVQKFADYRLSPFEIGIDGMFLDGPEQASVSSIVSNFNLTRKAEVFTKAQMNAMDREGFIDPLISNRFAQERMNYEFTFPELQWESLAGRSFNWRDFSNFISVLDFVDLINTDPKFSQIRAQSQYLPLLDLFPRIQDFKSDFETAFVRSMLRKVNDTAKINASYFLGAPVKNIQPMVRQDQATIFKVV